MGNKLLLDCTLRDGGYVNDWEFGQNNAINIFERLVDTGVDIIEVGFIDERRPYDVNRTIFPDTQSITKSFSCINRRPKMVVGMIDYGTCGIEKIQPQSESFLDGIRVIFKKQKMHEAMEYCRQLKGKGYMVFSQLVSITAYDDNDLMELIGLVNDVKPYAVSMVDTYGLLDPKWMLHYYEILDKNVDPSISIGFHAHNNFQLAYANGMAFLEKETDRDILVDGTLFGMGKSAGNAPLELLGKHMNDIYGKKYNIRPMLEAIEESTKDFYQVSPWGYKTFFYMCASNKCHPSYLEYFKSKENLSASMLDELLSKIEPEDKKLLYDKELAESIYNEYVVSRVQNEKNLASLKEALSNKQILLLGPGKNIKLQRNSVVEYIEKNKPTIISINYIPANIPVDYVFVTKPNRYRDMTVNLQNCSNTKVIATSNLSARGAQFEYIIERDPLIESKEVIKDNSFLMFLKVLKQTGIKEIACAGFDGYSDKEDNYIDASMEYDYIKREARQLNRHVKDVIDKNQINIDFITYSHYSEDGDIYAAGI